MPRHPRIQYENAFYHVMNRGRGRRWIYHGPSYYQAFLETLEESHDRFEARIHAYCLMGNHYHLLVETPLANLDRIMRHINGVYTQRYNRLKRTDGPLFRGRYKSILIDESAYLLQVSRYIHRNPVEVKGAPENMLDTYKWSSYLAYIGKTTVPAWLYRDRTNRVLGAKTPSAAYQEFVLGGIDIRTKEFYGSDYLTGVFGDKSFRQSVYDNQEDFLVADDLSKLVKPSLDIEVIVDAVAHVFGVDQQSIVEKQRGKRQANLPRRMTMYCAQRIGGYSQKEIAEYFSLTHAGSVSSAVSAVGATIDCGELKVRLKQIKQELNIVKLT